MNIAPFIDHTLLKPTVTPGEIKNLCEEAVHFGFAAVCVPPPMIGQSKAATKGTPVKIATVIGFPFGYSNPSAKFAEAAEAIDSGADELDVVINLIALRAGHLDHLQVEMLPIVELAHQQQRLVKVIIESGILSDEEILFCCELYSGMEVDFMKTSTGYAEKGVTIEAVKLMKAKLPSTVRIKASGGIRTYDFAAKLIEAGASRLGCSASVEIVTGSASNKQRNY